jgi:hypothetical protein
MDFTENTELFDIDINHMKVELLKQNEIRVKPSTGAFTYAIICEYAANSSMGYAGWMELILNLRYGVTEEF